MTSGLLPRLLRIQFTPIMIAPVILGTAIAWHGTGMFSPLLFLLALAGSICLHLAANGIDDVYDYLNGTDKVSAQMFPPGAPGWKPLAREMMSVGEAFKISYVLYGISLVIGVLLSFLVGWYALAIAVPGILLSYFYTAPPFRLDYRGLGLGELSILFSFGPIPALGVYYVLTRQISALPFVVAITSGLLTTGILVTHDLIYYEPYKESGKRSLTVVLGKKRAARLSSVLPLIAYGLLLVLVAARLAPPLCLLSLVASPLMAKFADFAGTERPPPEYGTRTGFVFIHSALFTLLVALGFLLG